MLKDRALQLVGNPRNNSIMPTFGQKFLALLATGRVANLPTVWSNVFIGYFLLNSHYSALSSEFFPSLGLGLLSTSLLYLGGCVLGDYRDAEFDTLQRPNRPIPQGILKLNTVKWVAIISLVSGFLLGCLTLTNPAHLLPLALLSLLSLAIISYAISHKKNRRFALINMALCRSLLILFACSLAVIELSVTHIVIAISIGLYTFFLSSVAATESTPGQINFRKPLFIGMASLPILAIIAIKPESLSYSIGASLIYLLWLTRSFTILPHSKPAFVSNALAGFCLLDACIASTFSLPLTLVCFGLFGLALLLQKITPAT
jgi:4-hydroxybenzoate polyprenyltransferase